MTSPETNSRVGRIGRSKEENSRIEKGLCMVCAKPASKRSKVFCSNTCKNTWWGAHDWSWVRQEILQRDNYKCAHCGFQLKQAETGYFVIISDPNGVAKDDSDKTTKGYIYLPFVVDHKKPIALGGGEFDKNNLQVLCKWCNKIKTANDMADIATNNRLIKNIGRNGKSLLNYSEVDS